MQETKTDSKKNMKGIIVQFFENTVAYALPVFFQQFIVYPLMAKKLGAELNGLFLALIALNYFVVNITASVLVNTRLLRKKEYEEKNEKGDFNVFILLFSLTNSAIVIVGTCFYMGSAVTPMDILLSVAVALLFLYHDYITVQYRAELRFSNILVNNILLCAGYLLGLAALYYAVPYWQIVFIIPYLITFVYDWFNTDYIKEPIRRTPLFSSTAKQYLLLLGSTLLSTLVTYGDRLILYPLMDGTTVSVFSAAQLIGKMLQMISTPLSTFILAHLVNQGQKRIRMKPAYLLIGIGGCAALYLVCVIISVPMLKYLYPEWAAESLKYVSLTAANGVLHMVSVLLNVAALRYCHSKWQIVKSALYLAAYMIFSFALLSMFGLTGFCVGNIMASAVVILFLTIILVKDQVIDFAGTHASAAEE